ncbi:MAG: alpha-L-fucosidase [Lachnospiraceae bacterium]|nr:alpha-L-fucosidase [Lachnospiraceae bacterium]
MYDLIKEMARIDSVNASGPFSPDWESLQRWRQPDWMKERKLGIFMHWGLYSVPENSNKWYSRNMYIKGMPAYRHHRRTYGPQKDFGYKDFIPLFTAEKFDADAWISIFKDAGAGYICPVAEHHDGFQMYKSAISRWNAYEMGPKRDLMGELKTAAEGAGLKFCCSSHRAEHWWFMSHGREFDSDVKDPMERGDFYWPAMPEPDPEDLFSDPYPSEEYLQDWLARCVEIVDSYRPAFLYFDWWIQHEAFKPYLRKLAAYYYNRAAAWGYPVAICYKHDAMAFGSGVVEIERGAFAEAKPWPWQTDTAVARNSWCYTKQNDYKSPGEVIRTLVDVVSKGGNLLLNIGPKADGTIPKGDMHILKELGRWMAVNAEGINGAKPWRVTKEGPTKDIEGQFSDGSEKLYTPKDFRFTTANGCIYAFAMQYPGDRKLCIKSLRSGTDQNRPEFHGIIKRVSVPGCDEEISWKQTKRGLELMLPVDETPYPVAIKIETE